MPAFQRNHERDPHHRVGVGVGVEVGVDVRSDDSLELAERSDLGVGLRRLGYTSFRPGQREAVTTLLDRMRLLLVAPTGGGKSLCYQLPAILLPGTTLVISPLIALMLDQVQSLQARGIAATFLAGTVDPEEARQRLAALRRGEIKLCYVAPERLVFAGFRSLLHSLRVPLIAVDEAHCISEWGHDFRPEYFKIRELLAELPQARVLACTATATPVVRDEIVARLGLGADTPQIVQGFARPNLALRVRDVQGGPDRRRAVDSLIREALVRPASGRGAAIVYAATRKAAEQEGQRLAAGGWNTAVYHAGIEASERDRVTRRFADRELEVVVATCAFGMGIDRPDVRAVAHLSPPGSLEAYYQEVGRAGRDGEPATGMLLLAHSDIALRRYLIDRGGDESASSPQLVEHKWNLFLELLRWAEASSCRHDAILRYFGDESETLDGCGRCDVCQAMLTDRAAIDAEATTVLVRKALSGVARVHGKLGLGASVQLLRGIADERLGWSGLDRTSTFGIMRELPETWILMLLRRCVTAGWVDFVGGERPLAVLTHAGLAVMKGERPAKLLLYPPEPPSSTARGVASASGKGSRRSADESGARAGKAGSAGAGGGSGEELDVVSSRLFEALRRVRLELAREQGIPPFVIASDRSLRDIAQLRPRNLEDLKLAHGIGDVKAERYGADLLRAVADCATRLGLPLR